MIRERCKTLARRGVVRWWQIDGAPAVMTCQTYQTTMNIPSILRHWFTLLATAATMWLIAALSLSADASAALTDAFGKLVEPLVIIGVLLVTAIWRVALTWLYGLFRNGAGEKDGGGLGGPSLLVVAIATTAALMGGLPSCSPAQLAAARAVPLRGCVVTDHGTICYSSRDGVSAEIDATSSK